MRNASLLLVLTVCVACSGPQEADTMPDTVVDDDQDQSDTNLVQADVTASVTRQRLGELLGDGPAHFLAIVEVEGVAAESGAFAGWELRALPESRPAWLDVQVGDVITAVNGMPLERPEDVFRVYQLLQVASEVRLDLMRGGEARAVRIAIEDEVAPEPASDTPAATEEEGDHSAAPGPQE